MQKVKSYKFPHQSKHHSCVIWKINAKKGGKTSQLNAMNQTPEKLQSTAAEVNYNGIRDQYAFQAAIENLIHCGEYFELFLSELFRNFQLLCSINRA